MEIRPLLLYYGMTAYAKAVVVGRNLRALATLSQSHGLHDVSAHDARLAELRVKVQGDGLFHALNDTVRNSEGIRYFEGSMHCRHSIPTARSADLNDMTLSLKDILARTIRLETLYQDTFGEKAKTHGFDLYVRNGPADEVQLRIDVPELYVDRASLQEIITQLRGQYPALRRWRLDAAQKAWDMSVLMFENLPAEGIDEFAEDSLRENNGNFQFHIQGAPKSGYTDFRDLLLPVTGGVIAGNSYFVEPLDDLYISELSLFYAGIFLLSSLVRYRPQIWVHAVSRFSDSNRPADDQALALVEQYMAIAESTFIKATAALLSEP